MKFIIRWKVLLQKVSAASGFYRVIFFATIFVTSRKWSVVIHDFPMSCLIATNSNDGSGFFQLSETAFYCCFWCTYDSCIFSIVESAILHDCLIKALFYRVSEWFYRVRRDFYRVIFLWFLVLFYLSSWPSGDWVQRMLWRVCLSRILYPEIVEGCTVLIAWYD